MAKYATVELNKVASRKTGEIEAQCKLNNEISTLQNGEIVFVDAVKNEITKTYSASTCVDAIYLHFSNPRRYEDGKSGMENFIYENNDSYLPRVYKLTVGDIFTTDFDLGVSGNTPKTIGTSTHKIVAINENSAKGTLPNGKAGKTYRVIA